MPDVYLNFCFNHIFVCFVKCIVSEKLENVKLTSNFVICHLFVISVLCLFSNAVFISNSFFLIKVIL